VFARKEHSLALFLDDLQWLDAATLDLIEHLVTHSMRNLLLVGAYRDNEVGPRTRCCGTLEAIRAVDARVHEIVFGAPRNSTMLPARRRCAALRAASARGHDGANPGRRPAAILLRDPVLYRVGEEGLLAFDPVRNQRGQWNIDRIPRQELHRQRRRSAWPARSAVVRHHPGKP